MIYPSRDNISADIRIANTEMIYHRFNINITEQRMIFCGIFANIKNRFFSLTATANLVLYFAYDLLYVSRAVCIARRGIMPFEERFNYLFHFICQILFRDLFRCQNISAAIVVQIHACIFLNPFYKKSPLFIYEFYCVKSIFTVALRKTIYTT